MTCASGRQKALYEVSLDIGLHCKLTLKWRPEISRNLTTLKHQHQETVSANSSIDHASQIVELDTQKFRIAKAASDVEIEGERLEQECDSLKSRLHELEVQGLEGDDAVRAKREADDPTMSVFTHCREFSTQFR